MRRWTEEEINYIKENYCEMNNVELAKILGKTRSAVQRMIIRLALKRPEHIITQMIRAGASNGRDIFGSAIGENNPNWKGGISKNNYHYKKIQMERYPERVKARQEVCNAIKRGEIIRQPCSVCGLEKAHAHHEDYSKPLDIIWLCRKHHREVHEDKR